MYDAWEAADCHLLHCQAGLPCRAEPLQGSLEKILKIILDHSKTQQNAKAASQQSADGVKHNVITSTTSIMPALHASATRVPLADLTVQMGS